MLSAQQGHGNCYCDLRHVRNTCSRMQLSFVIFTALMKTQNTANPYITYCQLNAKKAADPSVPFCQQHIQNAAKLRILYIHRMLLILLFPSMA